MLAESGRQAESASDGSFAIDGLSSGVYSLEVTKGRLPPPADRQRTDRARSAQRSRRPDDDAAHYAGRDRRRTAARGGLDRQRHSARSAELRRVPTPRDPWAVVSRPRASSSTGSTSEAAKAAPNPFSWRRARASMKTRSRSTASTTTDMASLGSSTLYYDFDQFEQLRVSTGGSDVRTATAGVSVRMITKRGSDPARGSARLLRTDKTVSSACFVQGSSDVSDKLAPGQFEASPESVQATWSTGSSTTGSSSEGHCAAGSCGDGAPTGSTSST